MARSPSIVLLLGLVVSLISGSENANILGVFTSLSPSHLIVQMSIAKVLAENGHNVTVVTALKSPIHHKDINFIHIALTEAEEELMSAMISGMASSNSKNILKTIFKLVSQMGFFTQKMYDTMNSPRVKELYENGNVNKFDLVMVGYFMNNYQIGIAKKLKVPVIFAASMPPMEFLGDILGNPKEASYVPGMNVATKKGEPMTFVQRLSNYIAALGFRVFGAILESRDSVLYKKLYGDDPNMPKYDDLTKNVSLIFCNSYAPSEGPIRPNVPGIIEVGGIQVKEKPAPLPKNLADFIENAPNGAILLSLGSNVKSSHLKPEIVQKMYNVLSKLKQRVIWKWENPDQTPGKSSNILYSKWLPQDDILAHPNIKLFITHAGKGGISEAQYHGKPMLALPVFGDQNGNADKMAQDGFGLALNLMELEEQPFHEALVQVLEQPQYAENVKKFSALYRDRPMTARQSVLYWTEYVLRHHGAPHLQSPRIHMSIIAVYNLDVYALLLTVLLVILFVTKFVVTIIWRKISGKPKKVATTKKAKKH